MTLLHIDLQPYLEDGENWEMLRHPLLFAVPYYGNMNQHYNEVYKHKLEHADRCMTEGNIGGYLAIHEKPYRLDAFMTYVKSRSISDKQYWENLADVWIGSENINQHADAWRQLFTSSHDKRHLMMDSDELAELNAMPDVITVYRGNKQTDADSMFSWTTSLKTAEWFRDRFARHEGALITGQVRRSDVIAYVTGRNESEIIALPEHVEIES